MKVLLNKLKKCNKLFLGIYLVTFILYLIVYIIFIKNLLGLSGIETLIRSIVIGIFGIWFIVYFLWSLINLILKKHITLIITTILTIIFVVIFSVANYYLDVVYKGIDNLAEAEYVTYTSNLIVMNGTSLNENSKLGMINTEKDIEGNVLAKELIKDKKLDNLEVIEYSSYYEMIYDLMEGNIQGTFLNTNYLTIYSEEEFEPLKNSTILYTYSKKMKNQDSEISSKKSLKEPFTILLMGVDSEADGLDANAGFNGDTLMIITFNPKTLNATMFSIPRDTYVPIACNNNRYAKINSAAGYGTSCVISTIEQLTDIKIDYYVKINFKGVVDLVEALDGIDIDVEVPDYKLYYKAHNGRVCEQDSLRRFGDNLICMDTGMQHLNGEQALAYARCRHAYLQSDIARNRHQQQVVEALARKIANPSNINRFEELLNAITNNMKTNMEKKQMLSFYEVLKEMVLKSFGDGDFVKIQKTYLEYYSLPVRYGNMTLSAVGYYPDSLNAIINLMKVNLELEEKEMIKTFSFDANEEYTTKVTGQGITTGGRLETMPNFIGKTVNEVESWAINHNITLNKEFVDSDSSYYNVNVLPGMIANQSISANTLINEISELTIYINNTSSQIVTPEPKPKPNEENNGNSNNDENNKPDDNEENNTDLPDVILPSQPGEDEEDSDTNEETNQD